MSEGEGKVSQPDVKGRGERKLQGCQRECHKSRRQCQLDPNVGVVEKATVTGVGEKEELKGIFQVQ